MGHVIILGIRAIFAGFLSMLALIRPKWYTKSKN